MSALTTTTETVGFIGAGNMASALVRAMLRAGWERERLWITDLDSVRCDSLVSELGVRAAPTAAELIQHADVVFLAVKPAGVAPLLRGLAVERREQLWVSVAAGITTATIEEALGGSPRVVRTMPNTPALIGAGATALCKGRHATAADLVLAEKLLAAGGVTALVDESMMDAVTGLSGSGPAFVMLVVEALADGGVRAGLPRATALKLATQTVLGSAQLLQQTGQHPAELKDAVASPGGTTIAGIEALERSGLRGALIGAVVAAALRSKEMSSG